MSVYQPPQPPSPYGNFPPATKLPFWSRTKVGVAAGIVGLVLGSAGAASGDDTGSAKKDDKSSSSLAAADLNGAVEKATDELEDELEQEQAEAEAAVSDAEQVAAKAKTDAAKAKKDLAAFKKQAKVTKAKAVAAAIAAERARQAAVEPPAPVPFADTSNDTDPRFSYCYEANDAGYGPYRDGVDPEYDWYDDRDDDGIVCES